MKLWHIDIQDFPDDWYRQTAMQFPEEVFSEIDRYHSMNDKKSRLLARLLIRLYCWKEGHDWNWSDWKKGKNQKPFLEKGPFFNISHSGTKVVVCFSNREEIGVDIEQIAAIDVNALGSYFHPDEITFLEQKTEEAFFTVWARKEAFLKAVGIGLLDGLNQVSVLDDEVFYNDRTWHLKDCNLFESYKTSVCSASGIDDITVKHVNILELKTFIDEKNLL